MRRLGGILAIVASVGNAALAQESSRRDISSPPADARSQRSAGIDVTLPNPIPAVPAGPVITTTNVIADGETQKLVQSGFPAHLHYRVELWSRGGWFDDMVSSVEWDITVRYEPLTKTYRVARFVGNRAETIGRFERYQDAQAAIARPFVAPLPARRTRARQYYNVVLEVQVMSLSDLDELEQWLRGELRPAVRGKRNPGTALGRGLATLATRLLGGEARRYEQRTATFRTR